MTPGEASRVFKEQRAFFDHPEVKERKRALDQAEKVLKDYFREHAKDRYQGVICRRQPYTYFDTKAAKEALGARVAEFEEERERLSLALGS